MSSLSRAFILLPCWNPHWDSSYNWTARAQNTLRT